MTTIIRRSQVKSTTEAKLIYQLKIASALLAGFYYFVTYVFYVQLKKEHIGKRLLIELKYEKSCVYMQLSLPASFKK